MVSFSNRLQNPGRFRASNGNTDFDAASALRGQGQGHFSIAGCNDVNTIER